MRDSPRGNRPAGSARLRWAALPGLVFLAASVGIGAAGYAYQRWQEQLVRARAEQQLSAVAESKASQMVVWRRERIGDARLCLSTPVAAEPALAVVAGEGSQGMRDALATLYQSLRDSYHYRSVCLADGGGRVLLRVGDHCASPSRLGALVARALDDADVVVSDLVSDAETAEAHVAVVAPLRRGSTRGAVVLRMDARDFLFPLLRSWPAASETGEIHLVRLEGQDVVDLSEPLSSWGTVRAARLAATRPELPPALAVLRPRQPLLARDRGGERVLAVARAIPDTSWFVVAQLDAAEIDGPVRHVGRVVAAMVAGLVLTAAAILTLWWRRQKQAEGLLRQSEESLRAANARLQEADRRKDEFLGMLSHELRNPLAPIRNSLYVLDRAEPGSERAARAQQVIGRQVEHLTKLVNDLLDVTRISRGKIELHPRRLDARALVTRACDDHRTMFQHRGMSLTVDAPAPTWIEADETRMTQVVGNLLQNACRFGRSGGSAVVSVGVADGQAQIRVRDDGIGIPPGFLPRLFEPFAQADSGLARTQGGLGIGLALAKGLVALHGGSVSARSDGAGRGAEFTVTLPLSQAPVQPLHDSPRAVAAEALRVLIIDDNVDETTSLREALELIGHRVEAAFDGPEGIEKARAFRPDVVLCDIGLPGMSGYEVARALRRDPELARLWLVAVTGYAGPADVVAAREAGFDDHVAKPARVPDLDRAMRAASVAVATGAASR